MPVSANGVWETTKDTGAGPLTLERVNGRVRFAGTFSTGGSDTFWYWIANRAADEWELGSGSISASHVLTRDTVIASSNSDSLVEFTVGTKDVTSDIPYAFQVQTAASQTLTNKTLSSPTINSPSLGTDSVDAITEIASALRSGSDTTLVTGTAGTNGNLSSWNADGDLVDSGLAPSGSDASAITGTPGTNGDLAQWNADGDLVDGPTPPSGTIVGTTDTQTLTNKTIDVDSNTVQNLNDEDVGAAASATNYTPTGSTVEGHLAGIDTAIGGISIPTQASCRVLRSTTQSISDSTVTTVNWNSEDFDTDSMHDNSTNNTRITAKTAGKYVIVVAVVFAANDTGIRQIILNKNGSLHQQQIFANNASGEDQLSMSSVVSLAVNDYVEVDVYQASGGALNVQTTSSFSAAKVDD